MSRGGFEHPHDKQLPFITENEIDMARRDYTQWTREYSIIFPRLWSNIVREKEELVDWFGPLLKQYYEADQEEGDILKAALSITYDLLRRRGVSQAMNQRPLTPAGAESVMPPVSLSIPKTKEEYLAAIGDLNKFGRMAMESEQAQDLLKSIWELMPLALHLDLSSYSQETRGNYESLTRWAARIMYGALRLQTERGHTTSSK